MPLDEDRPSGSVALEFSHAHSLTRTSSIAGYLEPSARLRRSNSVVGSFKATTPRSVGGALAMPLGGACQWCAFREPAISGHRAAFALVIVSKSCSNLLWAFCHDPLCE